MSSNYTQFLRTATLVVSSGANGLDLSNLRIRFRVNASDVDTPNHAEIRVYNLAQSTVNTVVKEYDTVTLQAGYQNGNVGVIFQGAIKQFRMGRESNIDSYLDILAADGDEAYNFGVVNKAFAAGSSYRDQLSALCQAGGIDYDPNALNYLSLGGILPRGKTMFGMMRVFMKQIADNNNCRWSIQNGKVTLIPNTGHLPGQAVAINSASGMIGTPEQTDNGITVRCLLNPLIGIGQAVKINNGDINQAVVKSQFYPSYTSQYYPATIANDGIYRVIVAEHSGDTRGTGSDWYTELTCLDIDPSSSSKSAVKAYG